MRLRHPVLSPQARAYLEQREPQPPMWERELEDLRREAIDVELAFRGEVEPVASVEKVDADGVPARLYRPDGNEAEVLVWLHGGAWMLCDLDCYDALARVLANQSRSAVLTVGYRRAPEHRYPAATDDAWTTVRWAARAFDQVAVGGDSAGGNLAAAVALRARELGLDLALQVLVYPALDADLDAGYRVEFTEAYDAFLGVEGYAQQYLQSLRYSWATYVPNPGDRLSADVSPMRADALRGVAPALLICAEHDPLRWEAELYAQRLDDAGVIAELLVYPGQVHGFYGLLGAMPDAIHATEVTGAAIRHAFAAGRGA